MQIGKTVFLQNHRLNPKKCETVWHECEENVFREDERKQGGFRWRDKLIVFLPPGLNIFHSEVMSLPDPNLPQSDNGDTSPLPLSPPSIRSFCLPSLQVRLNLKEVLYWVRLINGSKPPRSCSSSKKSISRRCCTNQTERWVTAKRGRVVDEPQYNLVWVLITSDKFWLHQSTALIYLILYHLLQYRVQHVILINLSLQQIGILNIRLTLKNSSLQSQSEHHDQYETVRRARGFSRMFPHCVSWS